MVSFACILLFRFLGSLPPPPPLERRLGVVLDALADGSPAKHDMKPPKTS